MAEIAAILEQVKNIAQSASRSLIELQSEANKSYHFQSNLPREMKAKVDQVLEKEILESLIPIGLPILSEESGYFESKKSTDLAFIVDPLDGTVNFIRGIAPSSISIALFQNNEPVFGVLVLYPSGDLVWGGKEIGAYLNGTPIHVSSITNKIKSVLCTGIPSRLDLNDSNNHAPFISRIAPFGKVRMLGSASLSLLQVAKGSAEMYAEQDIMLWDVAAGLALVEGAGGEISITKGKVDDSIDVIASNGKINE